MSQAGPVFSPVEEVEYLEARRAQTVGGQALEGNGGHNDQGEKP